MDSSSFLRMIQLIEQKQIQQQEELDKLKQDHEEEITALKMIVKDLQEKINSLNKNSIKESLKTDQINIQQLDNKQMEVNEEKEGEKKLRKKTKVFETSDPDGSKNIWHAIQLGSINSIRYWLKKDPTLIKHNKRPFHFATEFGKLDLIKFFVEEVQVDLDDPEPLCSLTPLHLGCIYGYNDIVNYLVAKGANYNIRSKTGDTPLHQAAFHGRVEIIDNLINYGADPNQTNRMEKTPIETAEKAKRQNVILYFNNKINGNNCNL